MFNQEHWTQIINPVISKILKYNLSRILLAFTHFSILLVFVCNRGDTVSWRSPIKGVRPSPFATCVPNSSQALSSHPHQRMV